MNTKTAIATAVGCVASGRHAPRRRHGRPGERCRLVGSDPLNRADNTLLRNRDTSADWRVR